MKKVASLLFFSIFMMSVAGAGRALAADATIDAFWGKFKAAVTKGDKPAVFAMTQLPVGMSYGESRIRTRAQFMKQYTHIFAGEVNAVKCFETAKPQVDNAAKRIHHHLSVRQKQRRRRTVCLHV